jgi:hypothetical protein
MFVRSFVRSFVRHRQATVVISNIRRMNTYQTDCNVTRMHNHLESTCNLPLQYTATPCRLCLHRAHPAHAHAHAHAHALYPCPLPTPLSAAEVPRTRATYTYSHMFTWLATGASAWPLITHHSSLTTHQAIPTAPPSDDARTTMAPAGSHPCESLLPDSTTAIMAGNHGCEAASDLAMPIWYMGALSKQLHADFLLTYGHMRRHQLVRATTHTVYVHKQEPASAPR